MRSAGRRHPKSKDMMGTRIISFEEKRCQVRCADEHGRPADENIFEREWEVFVARYDRDSGKYVTLTYCCEDAIGDQ